MKRILHYEPNNGLFTWILKQTPKSRIRTGEIAGSLNSHGYLRIRIDRHEYLSHRLAWFYIYGNWPEEQIDHINRNRTDNRILNLRSASHSENQQNKSIQKNNKSGAKGVYWNKKDHKWMVRIAVNGRRYFIGLFDHKDDAENAYLEAAIVHHQEFSAL